MPSPAEKRIPAAAAAIALALALLALIGWITGIEQLRSLDSGHPGMKPLTIICIFALAGAVLASLYLTERPVLPRVLAGIAGLLGVVVLLEWTFGSLGIDELLFTDPDRSDPGRPSPYTALIIALAAAAILFVEFDAPKFRPFNLFVGAAAAALLATIVGYAYGVDYLHTSTDDAGIALLTLIALTGVVVAVAFLRPHRGAIGFLRGDDLGAKTARVVLPIAILVPLVLGSLRLRGEEAGLFDLEEGMALTTLSAIFVTVAVIAFAALRLRRGSIERDEAELLLAEAARHFELSHDLICTVTVEGRVHRVNHAWTTALEWRTSELVDRPIVRLVHPEDRVGLSEQMVATLANGTGSGVHRLAVKSGGWRWIEWDAVSDPGSPFVFVAGRDITNRRRLEEGIAERQRRLLALTNSAPVGIYELDPDGSCIFVNEYYCEMAGVEPEAVLGRGWVDIIHPDDLEGVIVAWAEASASGERFEREYRYRRPDGEIVWLVGRAVAVYDADEQPSGYLGTVVDITERREAEHALERERTDLAEAQRIAHVGSWRWDLRTRLVEWTEQNFLNHGLEPAAEVPSHEEFLAMIHTDDREAVAESMRSAASEPGAFQAEYRVMRPDGETTFLELRGAAFAEGAVLAGTTRDITAERDAERLKDEFFNLVSHELRTPLTSIIGYTELLAEVEEENLSDEGRDFLEVIERNSRRQLSLVGDLLMLSKVEAGTFEIDLGRADLAAVTRRAVLSARPAAATAKVTIDVELEEPALVRGDDHRLGQVVDNLVSNAIKFSETGGEIRVSVRVNAETVTLEVGDSGIGIPSEDVDRLFERMFRTERARTRHIPGTGLGLTIVKAIVDAHHGQISVRSEEGAGTTFSVALPALNEVAEPIGLGEPTGTRQ